MANSSNDWKGLDSGILNPLDRHWFQCELYSVSDLAGTEYDQDFDTIRANLAQYVQKKLEAEGYVGYFVSIHVRLRASKTIKRAYRLLADPTIIPERFRKTLGAINSTSPIGLAAASPSDHPPPPPPPPPPRDVLVNCTFLKTDQYNGLVAEIMTQEILKKNQFSAVNAHFSQAAISKLPVL
jgi:hypothetical protein